MNSQSFPPGGRPPAWFTALLVGLCLPLAALPWVLAAVPDGDSMLATLLRWTPLYVATACFLAWVCWAERQLMAWILVGLVVASYAVIALMYFET